MSCIRRTLIEDGSLLTFDTSLHTLNEMEKRLKLSQYGPQLWSKEKARQIRSRVAAILNTLETGDVLVIDAAAVEAFDFSFATELFGKTLMTLAVESPGRFLIVENLNECTEENLNQALESLNVAMIERRETNLSLLGKVHPADQETFTAIVKAGEAVSAGALSRNLEVNLTAMNERLSKLTSIGIVRREKGSSATGREQYVYRVLS
jgi:hypothetical protein